MALGRVRTAKRSSKPVCSSTTKTITFVGLCILGGYMLTTSPVVYTQSATRTTGRKTSLSRTSSIEDSTKRKLTNENETGHVFYDNQGHLPQDAIKPAEPNRGGDAGKMQESEQHPKDASQELVKESANGRVSNVEANQEENNQNDQSQELVKDSANGRISTAKANQAESKQNDRLEVKNGHISIPGSTIDGKKESEKNSNGIESQGDAIKVVENQIDARIDNPKSNLQQLQGQLQGETQGEISKDQIQHDELPVSQNEHQNNPETTKESNAKSKDQIQHYELSISRNEHQPNPETTKESKAKVGNQENQDVHNKGKNEQKTSNQALNEKQKLPEEKTGQSIPTEEGSGIPKESKESKMSWSTQAGESKDEKERQEAKSKDDENRGMDGKIWQLCNVAAGPDYIPCLDNEAAIAKLRGRNHFEHRERHCPEEASTCLVPLPMRYKRPVEWPQSRDKIWYHNVPHTKLAEVKGHQNWLKVSGEFLTFPGGGTQFIHGAFHYLDFIQEAMPDIAWGKHTRVVLDVGCGVASFGGYLFDRDVLTMSLAPKDEHEAQVQFALERGIPAISAVMGTQRLPFPSKVFDLVHCARCRVPWHIEGGALLLELNRLLRPGGYFVWSATPVYQKLQEDVQIWKEMSDLTKAMCWDLVAVKKDKVNSIGAAIYRKPNANECYKLRKSQKPPMCKSEDDPNAAWYVPLQTCMHMIPTEENERGSKWPAQWPDRLQTPPYWLNISQMGIYGKPAPDDFAADYMFWKNILEKSYLNGLGISWSNVRNVMDMRAAYGGFAAGLKDLKVWVMNVVNIDSPDTLPIIYERGLFGIYHDWCESFSTYPRTYDLLHAHQLFSSLKNRCKLVPVIVEVDRILRPGGKLIVRDESSTIEEVENLLRSLRWEIRMVFSMNQEGILSAEKTEWRPDSSVASS